MNYVFFGTPEFAAIILRRLINEGMPPSALVCNPDRPVGRKKTIAPPPTKALVLEHRLRTTIFQPETKEELSLISDSLFAENDFGIVAAYAKIIPKAVIGKAPLGIIGVHPSLLPKYRGPTPIESTILAGEKEIGVTLYLLDEEIDHGPILAQERHHISHDDTYHTLRDELANLAGELLVEALPRFIEGKIEARPQNDGESTYTKKFTQEDAYVSPGDLAEATSGDANIAPVIWRKIRALNPEPGVYTVAMGVRTKLLAAELEGDKLILKRIQKAGGEPTDV